MSTHIQFQEISGDKFFSGNAEFITGAATEEGIPRSDCPEVAFAGRSNVGKSSLINAVTGRRNLARASVQPGRTQEINFFMINSQLMLVDLPGYGYAKAPRENIEAWTGLTRRYVAGRANLRRVMLLLDARRRITEHDEAFMTLLDEAAVAYQLVVTKCDKVQPMILQGIVGELAAAMAKHPAAMKDILFTSAHKGQGLEQLRNTLAGLTKN